MVASSLSSTCFDGASCQGKSTCVSHLCPRPSTPPSQRETANSIDLQAAFETKGRNDSLFFQPSTPNQGTAPPYCVRPSAPAPNSKVLTLNAMGDPEELLPVSKSMAEAPPWRICEPACVGAQAGSHQVRGGAVCLSLSTAYNDAPPGRSALLSAAQAPRLCLHKPMPRLECPEALSCSSHHRNPQSFTDGPISPAAPLDGCFDDEVTSAMRVPDTFVMASRQFTNPLKTAVRIFGVDAKSLQAAWERRDAGRARYYQWSHSKKNGFSRQDVRACVHLSRAEAARRLGFSAARKTEDVKPSAIAYMSRVLRDRFGLIGWPPLPDCCGSNKSGRTRRS